jgi:phosphoribosylaminoimidazolecarboxamide formyltransferase/IMP cyclohydrolase
VSWPATALFSLSDKTGAVAFARALTERGTRILASGGTARHLGEAGIRVTPIEEWTATPELLGGRVKTLHPHVHAPILARRSVPDDLEALAARGIAPIDLVAVTLYPFEERAGGLDEAGAVEEIDIGGVALLRAAAKNHRDVIVIHDPAQYDIVLAALRRGAATQAERREWALATFARTARYDAAIAGDLERRARGGDDDDSEPPQVYVTALERVRGLRYGENPHQAAALYARAGHAAALDAWQEGKELSYNNLLDLEAAVTLVWRFWQPACVIVKHNQPVAPQAQRTSPRPTPRPCAATSSRPTAGSSRSTARWMARPAHALAKQYVECVAAPDFAPEARDALKSKKNLRSLSIELEDVAAPDLWQPRQVGPWGLLQYEPRTPAPPWKTVTQRAPTEAETEAMRFAWEVAAAARSNAIAIARGDRPDRTRQRPDQPRGRGGRGTDEGASCRPRSVGRGTGERWLLPVRGQHRARRRSGHSRRGPAGGLDARRRGDRRLRSPRHRDDVHRPTDVPALAHGA